RAVTRWDPDRAAKATARWQRTAREAAKQSRRPFVPEGGSLASTADVGARLQAAATGLVLHEDAAAGIGSAELASAGEVVLVVGPEGGIDASELEQFVAAGAVPVRLGDA